MYKKAGSNKTNRNASELASLSGKVILITGAGGMLGSAFKIMLDHYAPKNNVIALARYQLDVADRDSVIAVSAKKPDIIIHCAANVNADHCEDYPDACYKIQVEGTQNIIELAKKVNAKIFYPQSFLIFSGGNLPITEETMPSPLSAYGKYKLEAEKLLMEQLPDTLTVRMAGFFGGYEKDKNFVGKFISHIAKIIKENPGPQEVGDRVWQPTYTHDLAYNSLLLLAKQKTGIYNMASHGEASFYDLACEIVGRLNLNSLVRIVRAPAEKFNKKEKAARPSKAVMLNKRLIREGMDRQRPWQESLGEYLDHPYFISLFR